MANAKPSMIVKSVTVRFGESGTIKCSHLPVDLSVAYGGYKFLDTWDIDQSLSCVCGETKPHWKFFMEWTPCVGEHKFIHVNATSERSFSDMHCKYCRVRARCPGCMDCLTSATLQFDMDDDLTRPTGGFRKLEF